MEDNKKIQKGGRKNQILNVRQLKKFKMEDDQKIQNGRRPKKCYNQNFKMQQQQRLTTNSKQFKNKIL